LHNLAIEIRNPLTDSVNKIKKESIIKKFFDNTLPISQCPLALDKYLQSRPEKFYCTDSFSQQSRFLNAECNTQEVVNFIVSNYSRLDSALKILGEINRKPWNDSNIPTDEYEFFQFCEQELNPSYLLLLEGVFGVFIHVNSVVSRIKRGKSTDGLDIYNRVEELKKTDLAFVLKPYCNTTRNSIAHGSVKYLHQKIEFEDKNKTIQKGFSEYISHFDTLLDICNGLALAYKIYFFNNLLTLKIPKQVLLEELYAQTEAPWWEIDGCLDSDSGENISQLVIFITPKTRGFDKVQISSIWTAILAESYAPGYDRYFLSLRSPLAYQGFAAFDGKALLERRENKIKNWGGYAGVLEGNLIFWVPFIKIPKVFYKIQTYILSFKMSFTLKELLKVKKNGRLITARNAEIHRNGWRVILNAGVVIDSEQEVTSTDVKNNGRKIISTALKLARRKTPWYKVVKYLPLGYARISLFNKDFRCRELKSFGLRKNLIGTIQKQKIMRIKSPDIFGSTIEHVGSIKYAWNKAWLDENKY
jgi:hypothetical protein